MYYFDGVDKTLTINIKKNNDYQPKPFIIKKKIWKNSDYSIYVYKSISKN